MRLRKINIGIIIISILILASLAYSANEGVFSVDRRARLSFTESGLGLIYSLQMGEVPAIDEVKIADANGDGEIDDAEKKIFHIGLARRVRDGLRLSVDGLPAELKLKSVKGEFPQTEQGLKTVKADLFFIIELPVSWRGGSFTIDDAVFADRIGLRELIVDPPPGWDFRTQDGTPENGGYIFAGPKGVGPWSVRFELRPQGEIMDIESPGGAPGAQAKRYRIEINFDRKNIGIALAALLFALLVGVGHALTPGHGMELLSAYLVGQRGTIRHTALFGWVVTAIRTTPVFAIGVVIIALDLFLLPERGLWWLRFGSAVAVALIGLAVVVWNLGSRARKEYPVPSEISFTEMVALSITGGLAPSPSAMALLFVAVSLNHTILGLGMVVAFGFGLETMMTLIGIFVVNAPSLAERIEESAERQKRLPLLWGLVIFIVSVAILLKLGT